MTACITTDCTNPTVGGRRRCEACNSRFHRTPTERESEEQRDLRRIAGAWNAHVATAPRPQRNRARWWR